MRSFDSLESLPSVAGRLMLHLFLVPEACYVDEDFATVAHVLQTRLQLRELAVVNTSLASELGIGRTCPDAACLDQGTPLEFLASAARSPGSALDRLNLEDWAVTTCQQVSTGFMNERNGHVDVTWVDGEGKATGRASVRPGFDFTHWERGPLGQKFEVRDAQTKALLQTDTAKHDAVHIIRSGRRPYIAPRDWASLIRATEANERRRARVVQRTFTEVGFAKAPIPEPIWASISTYYHNNRHSNFTEVFAPSAGVVFMNYWEQATQLLPVAAELKKEWQHALKGYAEAWIGGIELEPTFFYGMRIYNEGAVLYSHVDREDTHAVSFILNIDQGNLASPWLLRIADIHGAFHNVEVGPGELVYYESARCTHGRPEPLNGSGAYFVNLFMHYRPVGNPKWYYSHDGYSPAAHRWAEAHEKRAHANARELQRRKESHEALVRAEARRAMLARGTAGDADSAGTWASLFEDEEIAGSKHEL